MRNLEVVTIFLSILLAATSGYVLLLSICVAGGLGLLATVASLLGFLGLKKYRMEKAEADATGYDYT